MNDELRRSLDRAAGDDPQIDLTESAWTGGRAVRRRRHTAQAVGGMAAAAVLAGAFALGGGVLSGPDAYVGPAVPTADDTVTATAPVEVSPSPSPTPTDGPEATTTTDAPVDLPEATPTTADLPEATPTTVDLPEATPTTDVGDETAAQPTAQADAPEPTPTETSGAPLPGADGVLVLSTDAIEGHPLTGSVEDLVAAVTAELGEPEVHLASVATNCNAEPPYGDLYAWDVLEITVSDTGMAWGLDSWAELPVEVDLPGALEIGMTIEELRSVETVVAEHSNLNGGPILELSSGVAAFVSDGSVFRVVHQFRTTC